MTEMDFGFGTHLMLDGYGCSPSRLEDLGLIYSFLSDLPAKIEMTRIMPPYVFRYDGGDKPEDWGISGFVLIAESHISIHTFPEKNYLSVDIFSCKEFDVSKAIQLVKNTFQFSDCEIKLADRGREFPRNIRSTANIVHQDRRREQKASKMAAA